MSQDADRETTTEYEPASERSAPRTRSRSLRACLAIAALGVAGVLGAAAAAPSSTQAPTLAPTLADLDSGRVEGVAKGGSVAFLGVPFAAPPVGDKRWRAPEPVAHWSGVRPATAFAPSCPQIINPPEGRAPWTPEYLIPGATSEDCLYLNVWRPLKTPAKPAPILFWIHGGGGVEGSGSVPVYDGAALASRGIIVVAINYRLGVLASLATPELSREQRGASGNYGVQDMLAALRWVKANAAAFGGDPSRVTIAGQSAGAGAVNQLMVSPAAKGLFSRAITESASGWGLNRGVSQQAAEANGAAFARKVGAQSLQALRALPAEQLVKAAVGARFGTVVGGKLLPAEPAVAQATGRFNDTPIMNGFNADEGSGFEADYGRLTAASLAAHRDEKFWPMQAEAAKFWSAAADADAAKVGKSMARDRARGYVYEWARRRAKVSRSPIYLYTFDHPHPGPTSGRYGTFHTSEVPYVFQNLQAPRPWSDEDRRIAEDMSTRWINFISGRAPDAPGKPAWPAFRLTDPKIMMLGDKAGADDILPADKRVFMDALVDRAGKLSTY
jgi:para-nitrobenzyl esterase